MKKAFIILFVLIFVHSFAQKKEPDAPKKPVEAKKNEEPKKEEKKVTGIPEGYGSLTWGVLVSKAKDGITGKLVYTDDKSVIISKDGELEYLYGFFYVDPALTKAKEPKEKTETKTAPETEQKTDEGKLYYVAMRFPYLGMEAVKKKLEEKYGPSTNENLNDNQGAVAWNSEKTIIIMWVDRYEKKPFCRRITYIGKDIVKELNQYLSDLFNKAELELIRKMNP